MALLDSNTVAGIATKLDHWSNSSVSVKFEALGIADGSDLDDEEKVEAAINTICDDKGWTAIINWIECTVEFTNGGA